MVPAVSTMHLHPSYSKVFVYALSSVQHPDATASRPEESLTVIFLFPDFCY